MPLDHDGYLPQFAVITEGKTWGDEPRALFRRYGNYVPLFNKGIRFSDRPLRLVRFRYAL